MVRCIGFSSERMTFKPPVIDAQFTVVQPWRVGEEHPGYPGWLYAGQVDGKAKWVRAPERRLPRLLAVLRAIARLTGIALLWPL